MSTARKYSSGITAATFNAWVHEVATEHGLQVEVNLRPSYTTPTMLVATVALYDISEPNDRTPIKSRQSTVKVSGEAQWGNIQHLAWSVLQDYNADKWNWTRRDRRRASQAASDGS